MFCWIFESEDLIFIQELILLVIAGHRNWPCYLEVATSGDLAN